MRGRHAPTLLAAAFLFAVPAIQPASADQWIAEWAPEDTLVFIGIPNCDDLIDSAKKLSAYKMIEDPALKDEIPSFKKIMENARKLLAKELGLDSPKELEVYPHGGIALTLSATAARDEDGQTDDQFAAIMEMGEDLDTARKLTRKIIARCLEEGATKSVSKASGIEVITVKFAESKMDDAADTDAGDDADSSMADALLKDTGIDDMTRMVIAQFLGELEVPSEFATAFFESRLVVGSDTEAVKASIRQLKTGAKKSLAAAPAGRLLKRKCDDEAQIQFVVNLPRILKLVADEDPDTGKTIRAIGAQSLGAMVMTVEVAPSRRLEMRMRGHIEIGSERTGIAKLLMMDNSKTKPPATVPADSFLYASININPSAILSEVIAIRTRLDAADGERMRAGLKLPQPDGSVLDIQKDIVDNIIGPFSASVSASAPYKTDDVNLLISLGHKSRDAIVKLMAMAPPGFLIPSEMLGETIYENPMAPGAALGITDRVIIPIATKKAVEAYIRSEGKEGRGLAGDPEFKAIIKHVPKKNCATFYANALRLFDAQMAIIKAGDLNLDSPPFPGMQVGDILRWMFAQQAQMKNTDNAEAMRQYQTNGIFTLTTESDGLRLDAVSVKARAKK